jgi:hypothetical protein
MGNDHRSIGKADHEVGLVLRETKVATPHNKRSHSDKVSASAPTVPVLRALIVLPECPLCDHSFSFEPPPTNFFARSRQLPFGVVIGIGPEQIGHDRFLPYSLRIGPRGRDDLFSRQFLSL